MTAPGKGEAWYAYQKALDEEVEAARGSRSTVNDRLSEHLNPDGTPKAGSSIAKDWKASGDTPTYVSTTSFTVPGDKTTIYVAGLRLQLDLNASTVYNTVASSSHVADTTTVTIETANLTADLQGVDYGIVSPGASGSLPNGLFYISTHYNASRSLRQKAFGLDIDSGAAQANHNTAANRYTIETPDGMEIDIGGVSYKAIAETEISLNTAGNWDTSGQTANYQTATNRAGKDFYVYAEEPASGTAPAFILSENSTNPDGNTPAGNARSTSNTRKVGGFHCLCTAAGDIANHALCDYAQGDILFLSVWDLENRPIASPEGMVKSIKHSMTNADNEAVVILGAGLWVDIYLASGTGASTLSVNGGTISDERNWMDFVDDFGAVDKQLLNDPEFALIALGSNEETNINGSTDPITTGGHSDTAGRRMISHIGCEDCAGAMNQWLRDQSRRLDGADLAACKTWAWEDLAGAKGSLYKQGTYGDVKLLAGGDWSLGTSCGSRCRHAFYYRWYTSTLIGSRGRSEPL